jgi:hypothetical protein
MHNKHESLRRWDVAVVVAGAVLSAICLTLGHAEDRRSQGAMSVTFHQNGENRTRSDSFYVTEEKGLVRWRNYKYKDNDEAFDTARPVYELEQNDAMAQASRKRFDPAQANAGAPSTHQENR